MPTRFASANLLGACRAVLSLKRFDSFAPLARGPEPWSPLTLNRAEHARAVPFIYQPKCNWNRYTHARVQVIDWGHRSYDFFSDLPPADEARLRDYFRLRFRQCISRRFQITHSAGPNTLDITLALVDAKPNIPFASTFFRVEPVSMLLNLYRAYAGEEGLMSGSVTYWARVTDAANGQLLLAYIGRGFPAPFDLAASLGRYTAAAVGIDKASRMFIQMVEQ